MRPITRTELRRTALDLLRRTPLRQLAGTTYAAVVGSELLASRVLDATLSHRPAMPRGQLPNLTAIIKTFERPRILRRLVSSIRRLYPDLKVIVADDSRSPVPVDGVTTIELPYNTGLTAGRNAALREVVTPYFLLLDDDFVRGHVYSFHTTENLLDVGRRQPLKQFRLEHLNHPIG